MEIGRAPIGGAEAGRAYGNHVYAALDETLPDGFHRWHALRILEIQAHAEQLRTRGEAGAAAVDQSIDAAVKRLFVRNDLPLRERRALESPAAAPPERFAEQREALARYVSGHAGRFALHALVFLGLLAGMFALRGERGVLVNVVSIVAAVGMKETAVCAASKGAITQLTKVIAVGFGGQGIRVNALAPGVVETDILAGIMENSRQTLAGHGHAPALGRVAQPAGIAESIAFLASPAVSLITGALVLADGGYTAL